MLTDLPIAKLELLDTGQLAATPTHQPLKFEFIYRAAMGVEWDVEGERFLSPNAYIMASGRGETPVQNARRLSGALADEMHMRPLLTAETLWVGFSEDLRETIRGMWAPSL